jgi:hypothetical protein
VFSGDPEPNMLTQDLFAGLEGISKPRGGGDQQPQMPKFLGKDGLRIGVEPPFDSFAPQETLFLRLEDGLAAIANAKLLENVLDVTLDGPDGD